MSPDNDDRNLAENSEANLDRKLDHAGKESFPTSDPVSVTITKNAPAQENLAGNQNPSGGGGGTSWTTSAEGVAEQVSDAAQAAYAKAETTVRGAADTAASAARNTYEQGRAYARRAAEQYPAAERYYATVRDQASDNPVLVFFAGAAVGFALAWFTKSTGSEHRTPDYARTRDGYSAHRERW
jgi:hypothetical protein